jgi:hypothetical protein
VRLIFILLVVQIYVEPWHSTAHVIHHFNLLDIMDSSHFALFFGTIFVLVVPLTAPTLNGCLPRPLFPYIIHSRISKRWFSLRIVYEKGWLSSLLPLIHLEFLLVFPSLLEGSLLSLLLIVITLNCTTHAYLASGQLISILCQNTDEQLFENPLE